MCVCVHPCVTSVLAGVCVCPMCACYLCISWCMCVCARPCVTCVLAGVGVGVSVHGVGV